MVSEGDVAIVSVAALAVAAAAAPAMGAKNKTFRVSLTSSGAQLKATGDEAAISQNGRYVAFSSHGRFVDNDGNGVDDCFLRDQWQRQTTRVSVSSDEVEGNGDCFGPAISDSGRYVAFASRASNFVGGDGNGTWDVFVRDRTAGTTEIVSVDSGGDEGNGPAGTPPSPATVGSSSSCQTQVTWWRTTRTASGTSSCTTARRAKRAGSVRRPTGDRRTTTVRTRTSRATVGGWCSVRRRSNLVKGDTNGKQDIYIHDRVNGVTKRVSKRSSGGQANGSSANPTGPGNGRYVAFDSRAKNLAGKDTNNARDVFVHDLKKKRTSRVSMRNGGGQLIGRSIDPTISDNGRWVAFASASRQLVKGDTNGKRDVFVHDRWNKKNQARERADRRSTGQGRRQRRGEGLRRR